MAASSPLKKIVPAATPVTETKSSAGDILERTSSDDVAKLAYEYWQARGCPDGSPEEDWFRAERELKSRG